MLKKFALVMALLPALSPSAVQAADLPTYPFIHVSGEGFVMAAPDMGEIDFDISAFDADPAAAVSVIQARVDEVRALLVEQSGPPEGDSAAVLEVQDMRKEMRNPANPDPAATPEYDIRSSVHIVVRDLTKWRPIMQALLEMKNIDHMSTTFGKSDRLKVEQELTAAAIKDALRRAEGMAAGFGKKVGAVTAISSSPLRNLTKAVGLMPSDYYNAERRAQAKTSEKDFLSITVLRWTQNVDMIFRIK
ncbi:SIMPL domain-containing protein [Oxalobacteraceae bacterium OTU3CINTB1]|nr:SIMPL domain-containing protein [Oxalobacteraceae bacterium OTU3CINTB1]